MEDSNSDDDYGIGLSGMLDDDGELTTNIFEEQENQGASSITSQEEKEVISTTDENKIDSTLQATESENTTEAPKVTTSAKIGN